MMQYNVVRKHCIDIRTTDCTNWIKYSVSCSGMWSGSRLLGLEAI